MVWTLLLACSFCAGDFKAELSSAGADYEEVQQSTEGEFVSGDLRAAQEQFLAVVPEEERTAAHYFVLGSIWFELDRDFAYRMHEEAFALAPTEPMVQREWAITLHRAGEHEPAEALYAKLRGANADEDSVTAALRADCLLALGRPLEAAESWKKTQAMANRGHLEHIFSWIYSPESRYFLRAGWLAELKSGDLTHAEDLVLGDLLWEPMDADYFVNYEFLEHDLGLLEAWLGEKSERALDLKAVADILFIDWEQDFPERMGSVPRKTALKNAEDRHWIGKHARLPEHPGLARAVIDLLLRHERSARNLLAFHGVELLRRAKLDKSDGLAAQTLVMLAELAKSPELSEYEALVPATPVASARREVEEARRDGRSLVAPLTLSIRAQLAGGQPDAESLDRDFELLVRAAQR